MSQQVLLDTQAILYALTDTTRLSSRARSAILSSKNDLFLSIVSLWETQIKLNLGKLKLEHSLRNIVQRTISDLGIELLPIQMEHIYRLDNLPRHHRDPFDRLLIAQAMTEHMDVISNDRAWDAYGVHRIW